MDLGTGASLLAKTFDELVDDLCGVLGSYGLAPGSRIGLLGLNSAMYLAAYFAVMRSGFVAVPLNHRLPDETLDFIARDAGIAVILIENGFRSPTRCCPTVEYNAGSGLQRGLLNPVPEPSAPSVEFSEICKVMYTSGSTGRPKGVLLTHQGMDWAIRCGVDDLSGVSDETGLVVAPFYHKNGLYFATLLLAAGQKLVLLPKFDAQAYRDAIVEHRCTWLTGVPTMFALLMRTEGDPTDFQHVRRISLGSAPLSDGLLSELRIRFPNAEITNGYGTTEAGPVIFSRRGLAPDCPPSALGKPAPGVDVKLIDGDAEEGVLAIRAPSLMRGYLNLAEQTASSMVDGWYVTGDIMRRDSNNVFYFLGRADDMFVCGGENIYPIAVEKVIESCDGVSQAAVIAVDHATKGKVPVAYVVAEPGTPLSESELKAWTLEHGPAYAHPREIFLVDSLPMGGTLKIDKNRLLSDYDHRRQKVS